jgi:hypothetical protein
VTPIEDTAGGVADAGVAAAALLARLASTSDDLDALLGAAAGQLKCSFALAGPGAEPMAYAPGDAHGDRALAVACAAAAGAPRPPAEWRVLRVVTAAKQVAHLAVGPDAGTDAGSAALVELVGALLTAQLERAALRAGARAAQRATLVRRLVGDRRPDLDRVRREAHEMGLRLADVYSVALLVWPEDRSQPEQVEAAEAEALRLVPGCLCLRLEGRALLLHPDGSDTGLWHAWLERVVLFARSASGGQPVQALSGRQRLALGDVRAGAEELLVLSRLLCGDADGPLVVPAQRFSLERLLNQGLDVRMASAFVDSHLGAVIAWDAGHGGDLVSVLEAALDFPRSDQAAERCFMHRNTFRHRLRHAARLAGDPLADPERRLALHVALKLHRMLSGTAPHGTLTAPRSRTPSPPAFSRADTA